MQGLRDVFELIWREKAAVIEQEICAALEVKELWSYITKPSNLPRSPQALFEKCKESADILGLCLQSQVAIRCGFIILASPIKHFIHA